MTTRALGCTVQRGLISLWWLASKASAYVYQVCQSWIQQSHYLMELIMHLVIDGFGCDYHQLADENHVHSFLDVFPDAIKMTKISEPSVQIYYAPKKEDWGVSGFVIIAESHISVHTFPSRRHVNIDVFSCKEFDPEPVLDEVRKLFSMETIRSWILERGLEHLDPENAGEMIQAERATITKHS